MILIVWLLISLITVFVEPLGWTVVALALAAGWFRARAAATIGLAVVGGTLRYLLYSPKAADVEALHQSNSALVEMGLQLQPWLNAITMAVVTLVAVSLGHWLRDFVRKLIGAAAE